MSREFLSLSTLKLKSSKKRTKETSKNKRGTSYMKSMKQKKAASESQCKASNKHTSLKLQWSILFTCFFSFSEESTFPEPHKDDMEDFVKPDARSSHLAEDEYMYGPLPML